MQEPEPEPDPDSLEKESLTLGAWLATIGLTTHAETIGSYVSESTQLQDLVRMWEVEREDKEAEATG